MQINEDLLLTDRSSLIGSSNKPIFLDTYFNLRNFNQPEKIQSTLISDRGHNSRRLQESDVKNAILKASQNSTATARQSTLIQPLQQEHQRKGEEDLFAYEKPDEAYQSQDHKLELNQRSRRTKQKQAKVTDRVQSFHNINKPELPKVDKEEEEEDVEHQPNSFEMCKCQKCGRSFFTHRFQKHQQYCDSLNRPHSQLSGLQSRKQHYQHQNLNESTYSNTANQNMMIGSSLSTSKTMKDIKLPKWKKEHLQFITNIRGGVLKDEKEEINPEVLQQINDADYIQCEFQAFDRHYEACKNMKHKPKPPPSLSVTTQNYYYITKRHREDTSHEIIDEEKAQSPFKTNLLQQQKDHLRKFSKSKQNRLIKNQMINNNVSTTASSTNMMHPFNLSIKNKPPKMPNKTLVNVSLSRSKQRPQIQNDSILLIQNQSIQSINDTSMPSIRNYVASNNKSFNLEETPKKVLKNNSKFKFPRFVTKSSHLQQQIDEMQNLEESFTTAAVRDEIQIQSHQSPQTNDYQNQQLQFSDQPNQIYNHLSSLAERSHKYAKHVQCFNCKKFFSKKAGERHIPVCNKIINKPKMLLKNSRDFKIRQSQPSQPTSMNHQMSQISITISNTNNNQQQQINLTAVNSQYIDRLQLMQQKSQQNSDIINTGMRANTEISDENLTQRDCQQILPSTRNSLLVLKKKETSLNTRKKRIKIMDLIQKKISNKEPQTQLATYQDVQNFDQQLYQQPLDHQHYQQFQSLNNRNISNSSTIKKHKVTNLVSNVDVSKELYCTSCGIQYQNSDKFCGQCGVKRKILIKRAQSRPRQQQQQQHQSLERQSMLLKHMQLKQRSPQLVKTVKSNIQNLLIVE